MRKSMRVVSEFSEIKNVFVSVEDFTGLESLIEGCPGVKFFVSSDCFERLKSESFFEKFKSQIFEDYFYMKDHVANGFSVFSPKLLMGVLAERYCLNDQGALRNNRIEPIDLLIINFGDKKFADFNRENISAFNILLSGINNFSRVMILTDHNDYKTFVTTSTKRTFNKQVLFKTEIYSRFEAAKKASKLLSTILYRNSLMNFDTELKKYELIVSANANRATV